MSEAARIASGPNGFRVDVEPDRDVVVVRPCGELDLATAPVLDAQLQELYDSGFRRMTLDLVGLTFIDSTGLRVPVRWSRQARDDGFELRLLPGVPAVHYVFELTGLVDVLPFADRRREDS